MLTLVNVVLLVVFVLKCRTQDSITFSPDRAPCVGDPIEMICSIVPPPSEMFGGSVASVSINGSIDFTLALLNSNDVIGGIDLSRYSANTIGLNPSAAMPVIRLIINSYLPLDNDTTFQCATTFVNGTPHASNVSDSPMRQADPPSSLVSLTAGYNSPTCSGTVQLAWTPGASDRDIEMYFLSLNGVMIASLGPSVRNDTHMLILQRDTEYTYSIVAMSCAGNSTHTYADTISIGNPPSSLVVTLSQTNNSCNNTLISWYTPSSDRSVTSYSVYRDGTLIYNGPDNQYTDNTQLNINTVYEYSVVTISCAGSSTAGVKSIRIGSYSLTRLSISYDNITNTVFIDWTLTSNQQTVSITISYSIVLIYSYTQNNITYHYSTTNTFSQISTDTDFTQQLTEQLFYSTELVQTDITALLTITQQCNTLISGVGSSAMYSSEYTPVQTTTTQPDTVPSFVVIIFIVTIVLILLVSLSVITALVIALVVLYRKIQQLTHTATPTAEIHPYEYIDMDKVVEHMSPARTADDTDYIQMTNPQYSNLK